MGHILLGRAGAALLFTAMCCRAADAPSWVQEISSRSLPSYPAKVPAAVLLDEQHITVDVSGKVTTDIRKAIKILNREGRDKAEAVIPYINGSDKIKELHSWLVAPGGFVKAYGKESVADISPVTESLYDEFRLRIARADNPEVGAVFVYEAIMEGKSLAAQDDFFFQVALPVVQARNILTLPTGWTATGSVFNHAPVQPIVDGSTYTWELRDLPFREHEHEGPSLHALAPRLVVNYSPAGNVPSMSPRCLKTWSDVSEYLTDLSSGQDDISNELAAKAGELTASAKSEYDKIQSIARYVQNVKYVSIQINLAKGGGYKPHAASTVFQKQYGDCKDKANLMRAMLKAVRVQAYLLGIYSGDRTHVKEEWPSPGQFNHAIIAVRVSDSTKAPTVIENSTLGRLLIFDPTSENTPLGDLPYYEQGSFALVEAGAKGTLLRMPELAPESSSTDVRVEATLSERGELTATMTDKSQGQNAVRNRAIFVGRRADESQKMIERWLNESVKGVAVSKIEPLDDFANNQFKLRVDFAASNFGQIMQGRMLVFKPSVVEPHSVVYLRDEKRTAPVVLNAETYRKEIRIKLPDNFKIDELPENNKAQTPFGQFSYTFRQDARDVVVTEELKTQAITVPPQDYDKARKFFETVASLQEAPVVLVKN